ncbi:MAG: hypothetical protein K8H84_07870 [Sulfuricella denitrificans]|nr:hypothetical protein [Sulfuricella denitrificans]
MSANQASIIAVMGASGSGKSTYIKRTLRKPKPARLMIWDPMQEYAEFGQVFDSMSLMVDMLGKTGRGKFAVVFQPAANEKARAKQFDVFCGIAMALGNLTLVAEELKFVTKPGSAPIRWSAVTMTGRHKGLRVIGASQRPASIDKDFLGNCTTIRTGRLAYPEDMKAVAKAMQVQESEIAALKPLEWIEKNMATGQKKAGKLTF